MSDPKPKIRIVCDQCGSPDVLSDAFARWDIEKQDYVLAQAFFRRGSYCNICGAQHCATEQTIQ